MCGNSWRMLYSLQNKFISIKTEDIDEYSTRHDFAVRWLISQTWPQIKLPDIFIFSYESLIGEDITFTARREMCTEARPSLSPMTSFLVCVELLLSAWAVELMLELKMLKEKDWTAPDTQRLLKGRTLPEREAEDEDDNESLEAEFSISWGENRTNEQHRFTSGTAMLHSTLEYG